jgi:multidrug resistance protein MdtO
MSELTAANSDQSSFLHFLHRELSVFPGRYNAMLRYLLSSVIVIIIAMALNVPQLPLSLLIVFFATQQNVVLTRMTFPLFMVLITLAVGCSILILKFTIDNPLLRLLSTSFLIVLLLYLMRSSKKFGFLFFGVAITVTYVQSFVDQTADGEMLLRSCLWAWMACWYATIVTYIVNTLLLPVEPVKRLKQEMERVLTIVSQALDATASDVPVAMPNLEEIQCSIITLHNNLKFSVLRDTSYRENESKHLAEIATVERLYTATRNLHQLSATSLSPYIANQCHLLAKECQLFLQSVKQNETYHLTLSEKIQMLTLPDCLQEMYSALLSISLHRVYQHPPSAVAGPVLSVPPSDAVDISYNYVRFGVKTLLSVAICYIFYTSVQWPGIHTSMLTCIIVALPALGASVQKSLLRIGGCLVGSGLALFSTVFILPHVDSIVGLLLLVIPVIALSGWIAAGSQHSSYAGIQILFAFSLAMFSDFGPSPELPEIRDRAIGILLGIVVATLVQSLIWPETEGKTLRLSFACLFSFFATKMNALSQNENSQISGWSKLDAMQTQLAQAALEPNWRGNHNTNLALNSQTLLGKLRELHVALYRLENEYSLAISENEQSKVLAQIAHAMQILAAAMKSFGDGLQHEPFKSVTISSYLSPNLGTESGEVGGTSGEVLTALDKSLFIHTQEIFAICRSIPAWNLD